MANKKNIFQKLSDAKICYAVCVGFDYLKGRGDAVGGKDYFIIGCKRNTKQLVKLGFNKHVKRSNVLEYTLRKHEIEQFKKMRGKFIKVHHNDDGMVFEMINNSFKKNMTKWNQKPEIKKQSPNFVFIP